MQRRIQQSSIVDQSLVTITSSTTKMHLHRNTLPARFEKTKRRFSHLLDSEGSRKLRQARKQSGRSDRDQTGVSGIEKIENFHWLDPNTAPNNGLDSLSSIDDTVVSAPDDRTDSWSTRSPSLCSEKASSSRRASQSTTATSHTKQSSRKDSIIDDTDINNLYTESINIGEAADDSHLHPLLRRKRSLDAPAVCSEEDDSNATSPCSLVRQLERRNAITLDREDHISEPISPQAALTTPQCNTGYFDIISDWQSHCNTLQQSLDDARNQINLYQTQLASKRRESRFLVTKLKHLEEHPGLKEMAEILAAKERSLVDRDDLIDRLIREKSELEREKRVGDNVRKLMWQNLERTRRGPPSPKTSEDAWWF